MLNRPTVHYLFWQHRWVPFYLGSGPVKLVADQLVF
jgi:hypothetical protein